nr:hypothetical protein [Tanacetum cinerariifolium]
MRCRDTLEWSFLYLVLLTHNVTPSNIQYSAAYSDLRVLHPGHLEKDCRGVPRNMNPVNARNPLVRACYECGSTNHVRPTCPRLNRAQGPEGNHPNQVVANNEGHGRRNQGNQARGRAFMLREEETCQDLNIMTGIEPSELGFRYEIEIASGQLVEIDKVIKGCQLEIEGHVFDIDLIPFGHVRTPLPDGKVLRVLGKRPEEKVRLLMSNKANDKKQGEIVVVRNFPVVFSDDLSGLPPIREIKFRIELIPRAVPVARPPYRLAPSELEEFSVQLRKLQDKGLVGYYRRFIENFSKIVKSLTILTQKCKTFDWGEEHELAFQALKDKLCNAHVLALPDGPEGFVVYYDISGIGLGCVLIQKELFSDYDCEIRYHPGMANVVADALSRKERVNPKRKGLDEMIEQRSNEALYYLDRIWVPLKGDARTLIMDEAHRSKYSVHPRADKMYYDLRDRYLWPGMKNKKAEYVSKCLTCLKVKAEHQRPSGLLQQPEIPLWKLERIAMDFVTKLPRHGVSISIITDHDSLFTSRFWQSMREALGTRLDMSMAYHPQTDGQSECTIQTLEDMLRACILDFRGSWDIHLPLVEFSYNNSYHSSVRCAPFEALYGRKCRSPIIKVVRFGNKGKIAPRFVGPFEIIEKVGSVAYILDFPEELNGFHDMLHVSNLKKCLADPTLQVPLDEIQVDAKLNFVKEPVKILEREFKKLKRSRIAIVKVRWNSKCGPEFMWEREDQMKLKYPHLFSDVSS